MLKSLIQKIIYKSILYTQKFIDIIMEPWLSGLDRSKDLKIFPTREDLRKREKREKEKKFIFFLKLIIFFLLSIFMYIFYYFYY